MGPRGATQKKKVGPPSGTKGDDVSTKKWGLAPGQAATLPVRPSQGGALLTTFIPKASF